MMGWTISTFAGTESTGSPSGWRTAMFEFIRAINEREECIPLVKTKFRKSDGTLGSDLPIDAFLGMDPAGSYALENWENIMEWILGHLSYFTTTSGGVTPWTRIALEEDVDMFGFLSRPRSTTDALFFQQCKEVFDRLIYAIVGIAVTPNSPFIGYYATRDYRQGNSEPNIQDAWDSALADTPTEQGMGGLVPYVNWGVTRSEFSGDPYFNAYFSDNVKDVSVSVPDFKGSVAAAYQSVEWSSAFWNTGDGDLTGTMSSTFLGNSYSVTGLTENTPKYQTNSVSIGGLPRGEISKRDWPSNQPSTVPFSTPDVYRKAAAQMGLLSITAYVDIAGELTDQT